MVQKTAVVKLDMLENINIPCWGMGEAIMEQVKWYTVLQRFFSISQ